MTAATEDETAEDQTETDETAQADGAESTETSQEKDWEAEFKAQQRINRDLERRSKQKTRELEQKLADAAKAKPADDEKPDLDAIRKQVRDEVAAESLKDKALDKLEAKAARLFQNPDDARAFLAGKVEDFIDGGKVDVDAIGDALTDLLKERPYLGVTQGDTKRFKGTGDGGARGTAGKPQLTRDDLKKMSPDAILKAKDSGQMNDLLGIRT